MKIKNNQRGFMLLSVIFLTMIVAISAQILLHANAKVQQRNSTAYLTAINLANEQFAELESRAASGNLSNGKHNFYGDKDDLESRNGVKENSVPLKFTVETKVDDEAENLKKTSVTVKWIVGGKENSVAAEKIIRVQVVYQTETENPNEI